MVEHFTEQRDSANQMYLIINITNVMPVSILLTLNS